MLASELVPIIGGATIFYIAHFRAYDVKNLFIVDGSVRFISGGVNLTFTILTFGVVINAGPSLGHGFLELRPVRCKWLLQLVDCPKADRPLPARPARSALRA